MSWFSNRRHVPATPTSAGGSRPSAVSPSSSSTSTSGAGASWIQHQRKQQPPARQVFSPALATEAWAGQLFYVDEPLVVTLFSRIIANTDLYRILQPQPEMQPFNSWLPDRKVPADVNPALVAICLIQIAHRQIAKQAAALPALNATLPIGQPGSAGGYITGLEREGDDLLLRVRNPDSDTRTWMRLIGGAHKGWQPADLQKRLVLGVGLTRRARYRHLDAAGIAFVISQAP